MEPILLAIPGGASLALIAVAILLLFGGKKIPELARGLAQGIKEFKKASNEVTEEINKVDKDTDNN